MTRTLSGRLMTGGLVVLVGILLLLATTEVVAFESVWEVVLLLFVPLGVWALVTNWFRNLVTPVMIIALAGTFTLGNLELLSYEAIGIFWLFVLIVGLLLLVSRPRRRQWVRFGGSAAGEVTAIAIFGSDDRRPGTDRFTWAELVVLFGESLLDLRDVAVPSPPAVVETFTIFGETEVRVPADWAVDLEVLTIFGESRDRRSRETTVDDGEEGPAGEPNLVVTGVCLFGSIHVRD